MTIKHARLLPLIAGLLLSCSATAAVTYTDNFSGKSSTLNWKALDYACLTAGDGSGSIKACANTPDNGKSGALRLTPAEGNKTGAILSDFTFPKDQGLQVTFTTYTYGGNSGGSAGNGADGITFFLTDGTKNVPTTAGGLGGSLGYSCSNLNPKYEGLADAYLGLGIDEFGNYLNNGDNTNTGWINTNKAGADTTHGTNSFSNGVLQYQPQRIGLRGAGNTTWAWLKSQNPDYYSGTVVQSKVTDACKNGKYVSTGTDASKNLKDITYNYNAVPGGYRVLPGTAGTLIANESAGVTRGTATPITYRLQISPAGYLNFAYSYNNGTYTQVLANRLITDNNPKLPDSFRFGFSAGTGGSTNVHEITCFSASPLQSNASAGSNAVQSGQVRAGTQIYLASYTADNWWGSLVAQTVGVDDVTKQVTIDTRSNWNASCNLTGGSCPNLKPNANGTAAPDPAAQKWNNKRELLTSGVGANQGTPFRWKGGKSTLSDAQKAVLDNGDGQGEARLEWLRGNRDQEQLGPNSGALRNRTGVLGDIIDSGPTWVGAPVPNAYPNAFIDNINGATTNPENSAGATPYSTFVSDNVGRTNVVYVGANDGFMHGFRAGAYDVNGNFVAGNNDGRELIGFLPAGVLTAPVQPPSPQPPVIPPIAELTAPTYSHRYLVDATPGVGDLFYGNAWHTWLVSGVGSEGSEIFALDITDPAQFDEKNADTVVLGDWTNATLTNLGKSVGTPIIQRLHNGKWAIIFGSGLSTTQNAGVYLGVVDPISGAITFQFLDTGIKSGGIAYVTSADLDGDRITDYLYAGDLQGNLFRFDLTNANSTQWSLANARRTVFAAGAGQPISTAPTVAVVRTGTEPNAVSRVIVYFGTGKKTLATGNSGDIYATGVQSFYGIWDWDFATWNSKAAAKNQFASLPSPQTVSRTKLLSQAVVTTLTDADSLSYRTLPTDKKVCWTGSTDCANGTNTQYGWYFDLPGDPQPTNANVHAREQIIYNPTIIGGAVVVNTAIPPVIDALKCNPGLQTGFTMAFDPASGGGVVSTSGQGFLPNPNGSFDKQGDGSVVGGIGLDGVGTATPVTSGGQTYIISQTVKGSAALKKVNPPTTQNPVRVSWREIRN